MSGLNRPAFISVCVCVFVSTHQPSQQHTAKHAHHCHTHDEPGQRLSIRSGCPESIQNHCGCMMSVSFGASIMLPHICFPGSQGHLINPSSLTLLGVKSVASSIPHLFCPPRFSQSLSSASIFNQLSSTEGMRALFSAVSLTHYLAADLQSLLIP